MKKNAIPMRHICRVPIIVFAQQVCEIREKARDIAGKLDMQTEFEKLNKLISALLTTQPSKILSSPLAVARAFGNPYDPARLSLFEKIPAIGHSATLLFLKSISLTT